MGKRGPKPGEGGAPRKVIDLNVARRAAGLGCTQEEIATVLGIGARTFYDHLEVDAELREAIAEGREKGRVTLRRLQWEQAQAGNATMLIWLGKQLLGQRDKHEVQQTSAQSLTFLHLVAMKEIGERIVAELVVQQSGAAGHSVNGGNGAAPIIEQPPDAVVDLGAPARE
jgi:hypothetical protein